MTLRRKYHLVVRDKDSSIPDWFAANPFYWYEDLESARQAASMLACEYDRGSHVEIMEDAKTVEKVQGCRD